MTGPTQTHSGAQVNGLAATPAASAQNNMANGPFVIWARRIRELGYSPIPVRPGSKQPAFAGWSDLCDQAPDWRRIEVWSRKLPSAGLAVAGGYGGLVIVDVDTEDPAQQEAITKALPVPGAARVGKKGAALFFRWTGEDAAPSRSFRGENGAVLVDIIGHGRACVIPPTLHKDTGRPYRWTAPDGGLPPLRALPPLTPDDLAALEQALEPWTPKAPPLRAGIAGWRRLRSSLSERAPLRAGIADRPAASTLDKRLQAYAESALRQEAEALGGVHSGGRNQALFAGACKLGWAVHHRMLGLREFEGALLDGCQGNGLLKEDGRSACLATIRSGLHRAAHDSPPFLEERRKPTATASSPGGTEAAWPRPEPLVSQLDPAPYPVSALPRAAREAVEEVNAFVKAPVEMAAMSALSAMSLAAQAHVDVERASRLTGPAGVFTLAVADSGERKSTLDSFFIGAIRQYEKEQAEKAEPVVAAHKASHAVWKAKWDGYDAAIREAAKRGRSMIGAEASLRAMGPEPKPPRVPALLRGDDTSENMAWTLAKHWPSAGVISAEAGTVFGGCAMGPEAIMRNLALQNTLWDGKEHRVGRRTSDSFVVRGARLTVGLQIQEATLRAYYDKNGGLARGIGFFARFLVAKPRSTQGSRLFSEPPEEWPALSAFNGRMAEVLNEPAPIDEQGCLRPALLRLTPEAKSAWVELHDAIERELGAGGELYDVRDVAAKAADNIARLAAIFHAFEQGFAGSVSVERLRAAGEIVLWHLNEARRFFGEFAMAPELSDAAKLESWLIERCRRDGGNIVLRSHVQQRIGAHELRRKEKLDPALEELAELGRLRVVKSGARKEIHVNPALLVGGVG
jgi:hypothetical protein